MVPGFCDLWRSGPCRPGGAVSLSGGAPATRGPRAGNTAVTTAAYSWNMEVTWKPLRDGGEPSRTKLPDSAFAFPAERKEPLTDPGHVRSAIARFGFVEGVSDKERAQAFENIKAAAEYYGITMRASSWHDLVG